jgi:hypothetical protein
MNRLTPILTACCLLAGSCRPQSGNPAHLPDPESLFANIEYLDSLTHCREVDSVNLVTDKLGALLDSYKGLAPSPDDKAVLDSLQQIHKTAATYIRFCIDTRSNLELLNQDTKDVITRFKSGQINAQTYASSLVGDEQVMVALQQELDSHREKALASLRVRDALVRMLTPLNLPPSGFSTDTLF